VSLDPDVVDFYDFPKFCAESTSVLTKQSGRVPGRLSPGGLKLWKAIRAQRLARQPVRVVVLKARQVFVSTATQQYIYQQMYLPEQKAMAFGDLYKSAKALWEYGDNFARNTRAFRGKIAPPAVANVTKHRTIEFANGSEIGYQTADSTTTGRAHRVRHLHLSEYAFYRDAETLMTGLMQSVPDDPNTTIIVESTANGYGNAFHELCMRALDPARRGSWAFIFFAWHEHPEYTRPLDMHSDRFRASLDAEEYSLLTRFNLTLEQLNWRRWKIKDACGGSVQQFHQEYPSTPDEAFLTSGRARFDQGVLSRQPVVTEWTIGDMVPVMVGLTERTQFVPRSDGNGQLSILRRPVKGESYLMGVDTAQGIDRAEGRGDADPDYSVACVLNQATGEQVAVFRGHASILTFAESVVAMAKWYNSAFIVPEANSQGAAVIEQVIRCEYPISRIYWRNRAAHDQRPGRIEELGFQTTVSSKPLLIAKLEQCLDDGSVMVRHQPTLQELRSYVYDAKGGMNASPGSHDDLVIALALACMGFEAAPRQKPPLPKPTVDEDDGIRPDGSRMYRYGTRR
jgi:hypothetical protein